MDIEKRDEWLRLMIELAALDRDAYREIRAEAWRRVAQSHATKSPEEIAAWQERSS
jgi:hypothetical protein